MFSPIDLSGLFLTYCESTDVVLWGEILPSNVGVPRFSPSISSIVSLPIHIKGIIVGLILSDASIQFAHSRSKHTRVTF